MADIPEWWVRIIAFVTCCICCLVASIYDAPVAAIFFGILAVVSSIQHKESR